MGNLIVYLILTTSIALLGCKEESSTPTAQLVPVEPIPTPTPTPTPAPQLVNSDLIDFIASQSRPDYPVEKSLDKLTTTMWTTYSLTLGQQVYISYLMPEQLRITSIQFYNNFSNTYTLGDLEVLVSTNSTDGINGNWQLVASADAENNTFLDGDGSINIDADAVWVKLQMTYNGDGAYGGSPSFYINEIQFFGY